MSTRIESHPAAKIFPLSTGAEFAELVASIRSRGFDPAHPILLFQGLILDGRNRYPGRTGGKGLEVSAKSVGKTVFLGVAWPRDAKPTHPGAAGSTVHQNWAKPLPNEAGWSTRRVEIGESKRKFRPKQRRT